MNIRVAVSDSPAAHQPLLARASPSPRGAPVAEARGVLHSTVRLLTTLIILPSPYFFCYYKFLAASNLAGTTTTDTKNTDTINAGEFP